jgi:uncharacterized damage-inducible protein DinB
MSDRAASLATTFERANDDVIAAVESCSDDQLRMTCEGEGWSVVVTAHHLALSYQAIAGMAYQLATGQPVPTLTDEMLNSFNAQHAEEFANVSRQETLELLRREGKAAADTVRGLTDEQLDRSAVLSFTGGEPWSAADLIERGLIGHPIEHGRSMRKALGR